MYILDNHISRVRVSTAGWGQFGVGESKQREDGAERGGERARVCGMVQGLTKSSRWP